MSVMTNTADSAESAFESFFRSNFAAVVRVAHGVVGDLHAAQDIAQDVFIAAERRFEPSQLPTHAAGWVRVAAVHRALNDLRGERRRLLRHLKLGREVSPSEPEELVLEKLRHDGVQAALARLPRRSATVLVLRHSGLSYREVAEAMDVPIAHVGTMLRRAEVALRKEVERASRP